MFAARVGQGQPILLGDSFDLTRTDEVPPPPGVEIITTDGLHAWWMMTYQAKSQRGWGARIMVRDIAGQEPLTVAVDKAKLPAATGGGLAYVRSTDVDPAVPVNGYDIRLRRAGADTLVTSGPLARASRCRQCVHPTPCSRGRCARRTRRRLRILAHGQVGICT